ncbi:MAG: hypothetical protein GYA55_08200 [SAR324 cluster bacterium]|uniref:TadE-like domain-containing protein n=1 Tax=SAR324 cluster bacterium TaxID=2024889 RepID=A0A7X9FS64_9DELT|nr:hypothetical protein [SAR324 cluster bacterium]
MQKSSCYWRRRSSKGAVLLQFVLFLPLFLILIFGCIWLSYVINVRSLLFSAVENSPRLALTRGNPRIMGDELIPYDDILRLLSHGGDDNNFLDSTWHDDQLNPTTTFQDSLKDEKNRIFAQGLAYAFETMRIGVGESIRYPCALPNFESNGRPSEEGCLRCAVMQIKWKDGYENLDLSGIDNVSDSVQDFFMQCWFRPGDTIVQPLLNLFSLLNKSEVANRGVFTYRSYMPGEDGGEE